MHTGRSQFLKWMRSQSAMRIAIAALMLCLAATLAPAQSAFANHVRFPEGTARSRPATYSASYVDRTPQASANLNLTHMTRSEYNTMFPGLMEQGYRVVTLDGYVDEETIYYDSTWIYDPEARWASYSHMTGAQYQARFDELTAQGYRPVDVGAYSFNGVPYFLASWVRDSSVDWAARHRISTERFQSLNRQFQREGYVLSAANHYLSDTTTYWVALWTR